ncbi:GntR family transcriptional regulator [Budviciaceae bacterium CWB-B4]|uniref:GntR family transcriptional regulator n=1 Tax=Limnobaculum xujianqingii TaxID=2738837 RepID=A0A9D7AGM0_9GAMM|nr:GntR family transcriptional regulator [Limnobaculum xujianqingii]MBK5072415.1 GntR family transcriptional regulator [Limnobaculum xujianqingii]MBK5175724.1 GntR family transcriptional regulator [Limnobaculum xujianqingii]
MHLEIPKTLTEIAADKIRQMIISGEFEFGQQVTESQLSELFGLSKTPVREALLRLCSEHLIEIRPRCGTFICRLTAEEIDNISELRIALETCAIHSALNKNREKLLTELQQNIQCCEPFLLKPDREAYLALDTAFHRSLLKFANNPYLMDMHRNTTTKVLAMRNRLTFSQEYITRSIQEHKEIVEGLSSNDSEQACRVLKQHINSGFTVRAKRLLSDVAE